MSNISELSPHPKLLYVMELKSSGTPLYAYAIRSLMETY